MALKTTLVKIDRIVQKASKVFGGVAVISLYGIVAVIARETIGRRFFNSPVVIAQDIAGLLMLIAMLCGLSYAVASDVFPSVDIWSRKFPPRIKVAIDLAGYVLMLAFVSVIVWKTVGMAEVAFIENSKSNPPGLFPLGPIYLLMIIGPSLGICTLVTLVVKGVVRVKEAA